MSTMTCKKLARLLKNRFASVFHWNSHFEIINSPKIWKSKNLQIQKVDFLKETLLYFKTENLVRKLIQNFNLCQFSLHEIWSKNWHCEALSAEMSCSLKPEKSPWDVGKYHDETFNEIINVMIYNSVFGISLTLIAIFIWSSIPMQLFNRLIRTCSRGKDLRSLIFLLQRDQDGNRHNSVEGMRGMASKLRSNLGLFWEWVKLDREMILQRCSLSASKVSFLQLKASTFRPHRANNLVKFSVFGFPTLLINFLCSLNCLHFVCCPSLQHSFWIDLQA